MARGSPSSLIVLPASVGWFAFAGSDRRVAVAWLTPARFGHVAKLATMEEANRENNGPDAVVGQDSKKSAPSKV